MKLPFPAKPLACAVLLCSTSLSSSGLTLGRAQSAAFIGKPLDLRVQLQFDASEDIQAACLGAEVFYGDTRIDPARVSVQLEPASGNAARGASVRVQTTSLIDEPVVSVNLRAGCEQRSSRRYTLFPDVVTDVVEPSATAQARRGLAAAAVPVVVAGGASSAPSKQQSSEPREPRKGKAAATGDMPVAVAKPKTAVTKAHAAEAEAPLRLRYAKGSGKARLTLDSLDLLVERDPVLQASSELAALPQENPQKRAEAAALWKSLNLSPEEIAQADAKAAAFERDIRSLHAVTAENQKGLTDLTAQVQRAESERYANGLVYALAALCFLSLMGLIWVALRLRAARNKPNWSHGLDAGDSLLGELVEDQKANRKPATALSTASGVLGGTAAVPATASGGASSPPASAVDFDLDLMMPASHASASLPPSAARPAKPGRNEAQKGASEGLAHPWVRDFSVSVSGGMRAIDSEELMDVRQQADFFMSLGEYQKAIDILTTRVAQCGESSPLVCLDLLRIYHALGRETEYEFMRTEFNNWFTGQVVTFEEFGQEGRSLEDYPQVMREIVALWPDAQVLEFIENSIYHHASDTGWSTFDLQAFRELLLLHGVAKRIIRSSSDAADTHASEFVRIPARAVPAAVGIASDPPESSVLTHRAGAHNRGAWKRNVAKVSDYNDDGSDPQANIETRGSPLGAMKVPPSVQHLGPASNDPRIDPDKGPETDFNFLSVR